ncbi:MAG: ParB N-terminal domain-containing protein, partial [Gemmatimonadota bacterium]|nr:ParB N-terminal domain-containing protein [Gemmatimonadota bacterium]
MSADKPKRLGRGLEALLGAAPSTAASPTTEQNELRRIPLTRIRPNPYQPRREFPEADLQDLRASLQASGMLQPVVVR